MIRQGLATDSQRLLIDACLDKGVTFIWNSPGLLLIDRSGVDAVVEAVVAAGATILGFDGFDYKLNEVRPRLDFMFDADSRPDTRNPLSAISDWPADLWVDVTLVL